MGMTLAERIMAQAAGRDRVACRLISLTITCSAAGPLSCSMEVEDRIAIGLGVVAGLSDRVMVMYAGRIIEVGEADSLFANPIHPYTKGLLASLPILHQHARLFKRGNDFASARE